MQKEKNSRGRGITTLFDLLPTAAAAAARARLVVQLLQRTQDYITLKSAQRKNSPAFFAEQRTRKRCSTACFSIMVARFVLFCGRL